jgi:hypothetical protein
MITAQTVLADFAIEFLGIDSPSYFPGHGTAFTPFDFCAYGIGDTEEEALEDCLELMAQSAGFDFDEATEQRIRAEYGACNTTTVAEALGWSEEETDGDGEGCYFHIGIRWNEKTE